MKLIRENIAKRIAQEDPQLVTQVCNKEEYLTFLKLKLSEELSELKETNYSDLSEYADVLEVLETLAEQNGLSFNKIIEAKNKKLHQEGDLRLGLIFKNNQK